MPDLPLVSIITPSYNQGEFIRDTIESVLSQDYPSIEYIVMDGGSTDQSHEILAEYGGRIRWISEKDDGQGDAINKGWQLAKGEIVAWINSDDIYSEGAVRTAVAFLQNHPACGIVYGDANKIDRDGNKLEVFKAGKGGRRRLLWSGQHIPQPSSFMRADLVKKIGGIDTGIGTKLDYDFFIRASKVTEFGYLPRVQASMRIYSDIKSLSNLEENWKEKIAVLRKHRPLWFISFVYLHYLGYKLLDMLPPWAQMRIRSIRSLPRDKVYLSKN